MTKCIGDIHTESCIGHHVFGNAWSGAGNITSCVLKASTSFDFQVVIQLL